MSAFDIIYVPITRKVKTKQEDLSYTEVEQAIPGSPLGGWPCRYYRKKQSFRGRDEAPPGTATIDSEQVLSVQVVGADIRDGDIALLPAHTVSSKPERARVQRIRNYSGGVQCDIETGAATKAAL